VRLGEPRLTVAGLGGDSGKTLLSLGLARSLADRGLAVRAAKKGPDYIDAAWLAAAARARCVNLDTFLMSEPAVGSALAACVPCDLLLVEGNRGLYDGVDAAGSHSTAELAKRLCSPVLLVVDVTKSTRTVAALVLGCRALDPAVQLAGVVLNRVGTARQERLIRAAVEEATGVSVVGAVPRLGGDDPLPGRHLGLLPVFEHPDAERAIQRVAQVVAEHVDLDRALAVARSARPVTLKQLRRPAEHRPCRVGYFLDPAFSFYYPENLDDLRRRGAELVVIDPRSSARLPDIHGLYLGGGFPEVHAERLADNRELLSDLRRRVEQGLPVYAECGGLMFLARELVVGGATYPMAGVLDLVVEQTSKPQGHGYEVALVEHDNPFFAKGTELRGHEFHYSRVIDGSDRGRTVLAVRRGTGLGDGRDGVVRGRVWTSYLHLHSLATPTWADGFLDLAVGFAGEQVGAATAWA